MLRFLLERTPAKRLTRGIPVVALLSAFEVARLAGAHLKRLDAGERRRLFALVATARRGPRALSDDERSELAALVAKLEPRAFLGSAAARLSPVPVPKRLLYGPRDSRARAVASGKRS
ncbi:MAG TPA: hypothetical protein VHS26_05765 [Solirubrobacteraceae bacterium]|jgi:hypothetical protein|nr:hypothetical protein [Solirubrobacteraceae bacterium]